jgi:ribosomal protein S18 acetylase RimI-like enzyme
MITDFEINNIDKTSLPTVESISENSLARRNTAKLLNERSENTVARYLRKVDRSNWRVKILNRISDLRVPSNPLDARVNDEPIIGFYIAEVLNRQRKAEVFPEDLNSDAVENSETVGYLRAIAVKSDYEGKGVGSRLLGDCLDQLSSHGVTVVCTFVHPETDDARLKSMLSHYGFENKGKIDGFWETIDNVTECNSCEKEPCQCAADAFTKVMD